MISGVFSIKTLWIIVCFMVKISLIIEFKTSVWATFWTFSRSSRTIRQSIKPPWSRVWRRPNLFFVKHPKLLENGTFKTLSELISNPMKFCICIFFELGFSLIENFRWCYVQKLVGNQLLIWSFRNKFFYSPTDVFNTKLCTSPFC